MWLSALSKAGSLGRDVVDWTNRNNTLQVTGDKHKISLCLEFHCRPGEFRTLDLNIDENSYVQE